MPDPKTGELRGNRNLKRLRRISQNKQDEEIARGLELGLEAAESILQFVADVGADLVVLGTFGRRGIDDALFGDTAERVLPQIDSSLLIVKPTEN